MPRGGYRPGAGRKKRTAITCDGAVVIAASMNPQGKKKPGRPFGVPNKANAALKAYAGQYTNEAVDQLVKLGRMKKAPHSARVSAWCAVLDRGHGRPSQAVDVTGVTAVPLFALPEGIMPSVSPQQEAD